MDDVRPFIMTLWRLIQSLDEEEKQWHRTHAEEKDSKGNKKHRRSRSYGIITFTSPESDAATDNQQDGVVRSQGIDDGDLDGNHGDGWFEEGPGGVLPVEREAKKSTTRQGRSRSRRDDDAMSAKEQQGRGDGRGRTPSPKRSFAPKPPSPRDCPSPLPKMVSTADIYPADYQGWLIDQLRGRRVWCAVSDMLFCVFEKEDSRVSKQVILLPGCKVRAIEFKSANQDGRVLSEVARRFASKTITGVDKYQFLIESSINRQKFMFGVVSKQDLDGWTNVLERACCIDDGSVNSDGTPSDTTSSDRMDSKSGSESPRSTLSSLNSYSPAQTLPSRLDVNSLTLPMTQSHDVSKDSIDNIRRKIRRDCPEVDSKPSPMRVTHSDRKPAGGKTTGSGADDQRKSSWHFKLRSPLDLLRRKKRSSSADDAQRRRKMFPIMEPDTVSNPSLSPRLSDSQPSLASSVDSSHSNFSHDTGSFSSSADSKDGKSKKERQKKRGFLSRSWDPEKNSRGNLGSSIRRTASDFKEKMFGHQSSNSSPFSTKSRSAGVKLKDLETPRMCGSLQYKLGFKWTKVWCVVCRGCFYAFKSSKGSESPILAVVLNQCSVKYEADGERLPKRMFIFKMAQAHCKSIYLCAETHHALLQWMETLQTEAVKVQADDSLAAEVKESKSSQKKRESKETKERGGDKQTELTKEDNVETMASKRFSCPDFRVMVGFPEENKLPASKSQYFNVYTGDYTNQGDSNGNNSKRHASKLLSRSEARKKTERSDDQDTKNTGVLILNKSPESVPSSPSSSLQNSSPNGRFPEDENEGEENGFSDGVCHFSNKQNWKFLRPTGRKQRGDNHAFNSDQDVVGGDVDIDGYESRSSGFIMNGYRDTPEDARGTVGDSHAQQPVDSSSSKDISSSFLDEKNGVKAVFQIASDLEIDHKNETSDPDCTMSHSLFFSELDRVHQSEGNEKEDNGNPRNKENTGNSQSVSDVSDSLKYTMDSSVHDDAIKEAWSVNEEFLVGVVREKLQKRRQRVPNKAEEGENDNSGWRTKHPDVLIVNDDGDVRPEPTVKPPANFSIGNVDINDANDPIQPPTAFQSTLDPNDDERSEISDIKMTSGADDNQMEGYLERRDGEDSKWNRYWCSLSSSLLTCYHNPSDQPHTATTTTTNLRGYTVNQLVDKIQRKRFVLHLAHKTKVDIFLSFDSRDELEVWCIVLQVALANALKEPEGEEGMGRADGCMEGRVVEDTPEISSTQAVKQKLLAEMLRQKMELEKMQAARNGMRNWSNVDKDQSQSPQSNPSTPRSTTTDDRICAMTRLQQRRMSTQIKLQAIRRQLGETSPGTKEKKTVFQIGRKRPDLIQSHEKDPTRQSVLEEQVKTLSSRLQEIDSHLSSHAVNSPRDSTETNNTPSSKKNSFRHSYDPSILKQYSSSLDPSATLDFSESNTRKSSLDMGNTLKVKEKVKDKDKDVSRSNSFKSSVQRFAHRTFARANWSRVKKSLVPNQKGSTKNQQGTSDDANVADEERAEKPPDVIDITANHSVRNSHDSSLNPYILPPPDSFKTDKQSTNSNQVKKHKNPKERIWAKLASSHSFSTWDRLNSRIKSSASSPCLNEDNANERTGDRRSVTPQPNTNERNAHLDIPKLDLGHNKDWDRHDGSNTTRSDRSTDSFYSPRSDLDSSRSGFYSERGTITLGMGMIKKSSSMDRSNGTGGFLSARTERTTSPRKANRNSWAAGISPRKEVNPNVLAEIQAFEELSSKFLAS